MEQYEIEPLIDKLYTKHKEEWEQTRMIAYITAQVNSKKKLKIQDIIKFPWDGVDVFKGVKEISNEDVERLKNKTKLFIENGNR